MNNRASKQIVAVAAALLACTSTFAQNGSPTMNDPATMAAGQTPVTDNWAPSLVRDGAYDRVPHVSQPLAWQSIREADVLWKKRVWREIDTRQKQNQAFNYPGDDETGGGLFIEILLKAVKDGKMKAYGTLDDRFTRALSASELETMIAGGKDTVTRIDPETGLESTIITDRDFDVTTITKYRVKEDWIFDRNLGRMVVRIIGIAPMKDFYTSDTHQFIASSPMFWLYYPEMRQTLAQYEVFNPDNDVQRLTWDGYMEGRFWNGRIVQVSNGQNLPYKSQGMNQMEQLYQGQRDMDEVVNKELDMWVN